MDGERTSSFFLGSMELTSLSPFSWKAAKEKQGGYLHAITFIEDSSSRLLQLKTSTEDATVWPCPVLEWGRVHGYKGELSYDRADIPL